MFLCTFSGLLKQITLCIFCFPLARSNVLFVQGKVSVSIRQEGSASLFPLLGAVSGSQDGKQCLLERNDN